MKIWLILLLVSVAPATVFAAEKPETCASQLYNHKLSGSQANDFFTKCSEQAKIGCEEATKPLYGVEKMRALAQCIKQSVGD